MEYTEQEIEMLARYSWECENASEWTGATLRERRNEANAVAEALDGAETLEGQRIRAAARLMRAAREQGAAEMRERAALVAEDADVSIPMRATIAGHIRSLAVTKADEQ